VPVGVDPSLVTQDSSGPPARPVRHIVEVIEDEFTGQKMYVVRT
jgi:hypothetical protein